MTYKLLTLNLHSWMEEQPLLKLDILAQEIIKQDYSMIALQEINQLITSPTTTTDDFFCATPQQHAIKQDNFALLLINRLKELGSHYYWGWAYNHIGYDKYEEGVALLSKTPLVTSAHTISQRQDPTDYRTRTVLIGETQLDHQSLTIVSGHYSWWINSEEGFAYEWQRLIEHLPPEQPLILAGDFNNPAHLPREGYELVMRSSLELTDAFLDAKETVGEFTVEKTIDGWEENTQQLRIDYIFGRGVFFETYRIKFNGIDTSIISDHFGIESALTFL
ncbi:endonuclease/exonuclease/phosphatase family protein [Vagococcus xieshaowenii]|uniref:Hydrolase n=1 Tax=Vagococcus xieshaowenii TaxID=2562451 RepID=A0AAJ5EEA0_9ENTE|nr:endonuclease/exonuclease/phosphatase family protein [Vagococcus xieshaowenii]QCA28111.1 hydrolase [Vagococcus xieshaowenii]TFZ40154.1 hydrolase [Vagococcus xieshaowenii]